MSWLDKIQTDFVITCGDGKTYTPGWVNASKNVEYNVATFEFKELAGSLVKKGLPKGTRYGIEVHFQGEDHLDVAEAFELSAADKNPWSVSHPFYGNILVQPLALTFDNSVLNLSVITGMLIETITESAATVSVISPIDKIINDKDATDLLLSETFINDVPVLSANDVNLQKGNVDNIFKTVSLKIKDSSNKDAFFNAYNKVNSLLNAGAYDVTSTMLAVRSYMVMPYQFADALKDRIRTFEAQFNLLRNTVSTLFSRSSKKMYENNAGLTISSMLLTSVTNIGDAYENAVDVVGVIDQLLESYDQYVTDLDGLQTETGGSPDSYIPDADALTALAQLVGYTVSSLLTIAASGKQQRTLILEEDSNIIMVADRLYGYKGDDAIFDQIINNNNIGLNEMLVLPKGRKIVYYI